MKRSILMMMVCLIAVLNVAGQGINFFKGNYQEALAKAAETNKMVFIDFYTEWCGPCKMMAKEVFTDKSVGEYYNGKFIAIQLNAEDPANKAVVKQFKISAYPTLAYVRSDGKVVLQKTGSMSIEEFLKQGKVATGEELGFEDLYAKYKRSKNDLDVLQQLLKEAPAFVSAQEGIESEKWVSRVNKMYSEYIKQKMGADLINKTDYNIILTYHDNTKQDDPLIEFINKNLAAYRQVMGDAPAYFIIEHNDNVMKNLAKAGKEEYKKYLERVRGDLKAAYDVIAKTDVSPYEKSKSYYDGIYTLYYEKDVKKYMEQMNDYFKILGANATGEDYGGAAQNMYDAMGSKLPKEAHMQAVEWMKQALQDKDVASMDKINYLVMLGDSYKMMAEYGSAKECYNQALLASYQLDMQMTQLMIQNVVNRKLGELELLQEE